MVFISPPTEKTAWPVPKDEKKYHEDTRHFVCRFEQITRHRLYNANANAGDKRPGQRSEPSHRHRDKRQQTEHIADGRKHIKERCKQCPGQADHRAARSEEHTSELQSLMRISYAVFSLKKKKNTNKTQTTK